ncbi:MAG: hypothetical protein JO352_21120 [Chloroflexi bacterium]|nr:hypothetical protein [Chloroflexota bacterium]MBV9601145.1 hypothetical protein [Chloroflexota bacterium]
MQINDGQSFVFDIAMSGAAWPDIATGPNAAGNEVGQPGVHFQQSLSR